MPIKVNRWKNGFKTTTLAEPVLLTMERAKEAWKTKRWNCPSEKLTDGEVAYVTEKWNKISEEPNKGHLCWIDIFFDVLNGRI